MAASDSLIALQQATKEYVASERDRLKAEVAALKAILNGRTGGKGIQKAPISQVTAVAQSDIANYLAGK